MLTALARALQQTPDPAFRRVFVRSLLISATVFVVLWVGAWFLLSWAGENLGDTGFVEGLGEFWRNALELLFQAGTFGSVLIVSFFLFPAVMAVVMSLLLDDVAEAVERRYYRHLPPARPQPWREIIWSGLALVAITLALNLLVLPIYLILLFFAPLNFVLFYGMNGYLLGREYFEMVALRRMVLKDAKGLRRRYRGRILLAGIIVTVLLTTPVVNLAAPIVATAFMLHVMEDIRRREGMY